MTQAGIAEIKLWSRVDIQARVVVLWNAAGEKRKQEREEEKNSWVEGSCILNTSI
jgi:hypothetical protein